MKNYNKAFTDSKNTMEANPDDKMEDLLLKKEAEKEEELLEETPIKAMVTKCSRLNVRKRPSKTAEILCVVEKGAVVIIDQTPSDPAFDDLDDVWVPVLVDEIAGYVMGEFLKEV